MRQLIPSIPFLLLALPGPAPAQEIEDPGPHSTGWRDVVFQDTQFGRGQVAGRIYYPALSVGQNAPADPAGGPYPLVAHMHGWFGRPENYDLLSHHIASWGFVVASIGTETGLFATMQNEAKDTQALLHWVDGEDDDPASWLYEMTDDGDWAASGHSMGGGACMYLIGYEPRVRHIAPLQPYRGPLLGGSANGFNNLGQYTGSVIFVAGEVDTTVPWDTMVGPYFGQAAMAARNTFHLVLGMGHGGPTDNPPTNEPLSADDQHRLHRRLVAGFYRAQLEGEEDLLVDILGEGVAHEPIVLRSASVEPPLWAVESEASPGDLAIGTAGTQGFRARLAWSTASASIPTSFGILELDLAQGAIFSDTIMPLEGVVEQLLPIQASWSGIPLYVQALVTVGAQGSFTRTAVLTLP